MRDRVFFGLVMYICLLTGLPAVAAERKVEKHFDVIYGGTLNLNTDIGTVKINSHSDNSVLVSVELLANTSSSNKAENIYDNFELTFSNTDKDVTIKGEFINTSFWRNNRLKVHFDVTVPKQYNLDIETAGGGIFVDDIQGQVSVETSGGKINLGNIGGELRAKTSGGDIKVDNTSGDAFVKTSGGSIKIGMVKGDMEARTSGGGINVDGVEGSLIATTSGGSIVAELTGQMEKHVKLRTSGGNIKLAVPVDFRANLDASTLGGHVYSDLPVTVRGKIRNSSLTGALNGGGPQVVLKTSGGNIEIRKSVH